MSRVNTSVVASLIAVASFLVARGAVAETVFFPHCNLEAEPATDLESVLHAFGDTLYANEFSLTTSFPAFDQVFDFYLSNGVSSRWTQGEFSMLLSAIMNNDTINTSDDVFGKVWSYFCRSDADSNAWHAGVRFSKDGATHTSIKLYLYDRADIPDSCDEERFGNACKGYSWVQENIIVVNASPMNSMDDVLGLGIAHELQHVCWGANGLNDQTHYKSCNETMSTLAEYFQDSWRPNQFDRPYDASFLRSETCDQESKYDVEKVWAIYLYETFKGNPTDPADDLIYRWIRNASAPAVRMRLSELAATMWDAAYSWVGGIDGADRLNRAFGNCQCSDVRAQLAIWCERDEFGRRPPLLQG
jgi:hypothetical protein